MYMQQIDMERLGRAVILTAIQWQRFSFKRHASLPLAAPLESSPAGVSIDASPRFRSIISPAVLLDDSPAPDERRTPCVGCICTPERRPIGRHQKEHTPRNY
jgi:hypothetical protein